jgi:hypothetical protein
MSGFKSFTIKITKAEVTDTIIINLLDDNEGVEDEGLAQPLPDF